MEIQHIAHQHTLILNENYIAKEGDVCCGCKIKIFSCKSFVYSCSSIAGSISTNSTEDEGADNECVKFLLHKNCAELPPTIRNPTNPKQFLNLSYGVFHSQKPVLWSIGYTVYCGSCGLPTHCEKELFYCCYESDVYVCLRCALIQVQSSDVHTFHHPAHTQHWLALVYRPSSFTCDACNVADDNSKDLSYRCTKCEYWIHKTCGDSPTSFMFHCHYKHPLILTFSLPQKYHKFRQYCKLCNKTLSRLCWLYYCPICRFFTHFQCARASQTSLRSSADEIYDSSIVQLPPADESKVDVLFEQFVKAMSALNQNDSVTKCSDTISISHWAHPKHPLQLITINELKNDNEILFLQCDGCAKPIRSTNGDDQFYCCVPCNFIMHRVCGELPKEIKHHLLPSRETLVAGKCSESYRLFSCDGCSLSYNSIFFDTGYYKLHTGCVALPKVIKHEAHPHQLNRVCISSFDNLPCSACACMEAPWRYGCERCVYYVCYQCIMKPRTVKHRWDSHPLYLTFDLSMVSDHEQEFECEYCSDEIDTNRWFYHCSDCDLSLHLGCLRESSYSSNIKFGATDIIIDKLHPHGLTLVLNKKFVNCKKCCRSLIGGPVLECVPCKAIFCLSCTYNLDQPTESSSFSNESE